MMMKIRWHIFRTMKQWHVAERALSPFNLKQLIMIWENHNQNALPLIKQKENQIEVRVGKARRQPRWRFLSIYIWWSGFGGSIRYPMLHHNRIKIN